MKTPHLTPKQMKAASDAARREALKTPPKKMWEYSTSTAAKTPARCASRTGRSSTGKLASFTDAPAEKLSTEEQSALYYLIDEARDSNRRLLGASSDLDKARHAFAVAKTNLQIAEADLTNERVRNQRLHAEMAPLFHRLTA